MLKKIVKRKWYLQKHLDAPLLKERQDYLSLMAEKGLSHNYLLALADYLLLIVKLLRLEDGIIKKESIDEIKDAAEEWSRTINNHPMKRKNTPGSYMKFMNVAFSWLAYIGRLDDLYTDESIIPNRLFSRKHHRLRYLTYPILEKRNEYLQMWSDRGAVISTLRSIAAYQLHLIDFLHIEDGHMVDVKEIRKSAEAWMSMPKSGKKETDGEYAKRRFIWYTKGWLAYMGQLIEEEASFPIKEHVLSYLDWIEHAKGYSKRTVEGRYSILKTMMSSLKMNTLEEITPLHLDRYIFKRHGEDGCCRRTIADIVSVIRNFLIYAERKGLCKPGLACSLKAPRVYSQEDIPSFVPWNVIQQILHEKKNSRGITVRDYAVLLLLSVYGLRCGEVTELKLNDIDWRNELLHLRRVKNCKPQMMPLLPVVGDAIIRYIREMRFNDGKDEYLFLCKRAPHQKLSTSSIYNMVRAALKDKDVELRHYGPHSLRHGCATHLINTGHSLKEIADLLGHVQLETTRIYAKVDLINLRKVADMDWEGIL